MTNTTLRRRPGIPRSPIGHGERERVESSGINGVASCEPWSSALESYYGTFSSAEGGKAAPSSLFFLEISEDKGDYLSWKLYRARFDYKTKAHIRLRDSSIRRL